MQRAEGIATSSPNLVHKFTSTDPDINEFVKHLFRCLGIHLVM